MNKTRLEKFSVLLEFPLINDFGGFQIDLSPKAFIYCFAIFCTWILLSLTLFIKKDCHYLIHLHLRIRTLLKCCNSLSRLIIEAQITRGLEDL